MPRAASLGRLFFAAGILLAFVTHVRASSDPTLFTQPLQGTQIYQGAQTPWIQVINYNDASVIEKEYDIRNMVSLEIDEKIVSLIPSDFTARVKVKVYYEGLQGGQKTFIQDLTVDYKKASGAKFNAKDYYAFKQAKKMKLEIVEVEVTGTTWDARQVLILKGSLTAVRDYKFDCSYMAQNVRHITPQQPNNTDTYDELNIVWENNNGNPNSVTHFDIEWAWIDREAESNYMYPGSQNFDASLIFKNNSSRVTVDGSVLSYSIPVLYDGDGYIFYRVRPVQIKQTGEVINGTWSTSNNIASSFFLYSGHETNLNWQVTTSFAEDGKRKTVIQYFDGSLRNRQTVTKDNVTGNTVVAESFYDYQGRAVIQVLPAPTLDGIIKYAHNFNQFDASNVYPKDLYDLVAPSEGLCTKGAPRLNSLSGTSNYYSPQNPLLNINGNAGLSNAIDQQVSKYIPDGNGYVFSETRYTPDNTNRVASQGGVGEQFQLGGNHDTRYFYGSVDQKELDALFGTEVGDASHYFKNMVRDANGQYSVSYVDMHGRTIATALAGKAPDNLSVLPSYPSNAALITTNLLDDKTNIVKGGSIEANKTILVPTDGDYSFHYELDPTEFILTGCPPNNQPICYDCLYDLEITISNTCGTFNETFTQRNFSLEGYLNGNGFNTQCNDIKKFSFDRTLHLTEGEYNITKRLILSSEAQNWYRDNLFLPNNTCKSVQYFYDSIYQVMVSQNTNCKPTCESCNANVGTYAQFKAKYLAAVGQSSLTPSQEAEVTTAWQKAKKDCDDLCASPLAFDRLAQIRQGMLLDMTPPLGQYALLEDGNNGMALNTVYNIFKPRSLPPFYLGVNLPYQIPLTDATLIFSNFYALPSRTFYADDNGQRDISIYSNPANPSQFTATISQFLESFRSEWAELLLPYHPEYFKLKYAEQNLRPSYDFDAKMRKALTYAEASSSSNNFISEYLVDNDPFFSDPSRAPYKAIMKRYVNDDYRQHFSMWQVAYGATFCKGSSASATALLNADISCFNSIPKTPPYNLNSCTKDWDYFWTTFRSMYLTTRDSLVNLFLGKTFPVPSVSTLRSYRSDAFPIRIHFANFDPTQAGLGDNGVLMNGVLNNVDGNGNHNAVENALHDSYVSNCKANIPRWRSLLLECPAIANSPNKDDILKLITLGFVDVCSGGSDVNHPYGSSNDPRSGKSFESVLDQVFADYGIQKSELCNVYKIDWPRPYDYQPAMSNTNIVGPDKDNCVCDKLTKIQEQKTQTGFNGTLLQFIQYQYGTIMTQGALDTLIWSCNGDYPCKFFNSPISLPPIFQCGTPLEVCIDCEQFKRYNQNFCREFPSRCGAPFENPDDDQRISNNLFAQYINYHTGFNKHWTEYLSFRKQCDGYNNGNEYDCKQLETLLISFYTQYGDTLYGANCKQLFTQLFNQTFNTSLTFEQIQAIYLQYCGKIPDICIPKVTCKSFDDVFALFYQQYGTAVGTFNNCQQLFVILFNNYFQTTTYTWADIEKLYSSLCNRSLDICNPLSCYRLNLALQQYVQQNGGSTWTYPDCEERYQTYFNNYFQTNFSFYEIDMLYQKCGQGLNVCLPPISCEKFRQLLKTFSNNRDNLCQNYQQQEPYACQACFTDFMNNALGGTTYTYLDLVSMYRKVCGGNLNICGTQFTCDDLFSFSNSFMNEFRDSLTSSGCKSFFASKFNEKFKTTFTYDEIIQWYIYTCGKEPQICSTIQIVNCEQLQNVLSSFRELYPEPVSKFGDTCQQAFVSYFNQSFGTNYTYAVIMDYYQSLCGERPNVCGGERCGFLQEILNAYLNEYGSWNLPQSLCRDMFVDYFNRNYESREPLTWSQIIQAYANCNITINLCQDVSAPLSCVKVQHVLDAYRQLRPREPENCADAFAQFFNLYYGTSWTYSQIISWGRNSCGIDINLCGLEVNSEEYLLLNKEINAVTPARPPRLCGLNEAISPPQPPIVDDPCKNIEDFSLYAANDQFNNYQQTIKDNFDATYKNKCLAARNIEVFTVSHQVYEYHYTLYYYDQAGNLVKTVPPQGVQPNFSDNWLNDVATNRANGTSLVPGHSLVTQYRYNSLNQVMAQHSPDGGESRFYYDRLGRLVVSQNAKQQIQNNYSYTIYDELGRITEVGEKPQTSPMSQSVSRDQLSLYNWITTGSGRQQITRTVYDNGYLSLCNPASNGIFNNLCQKNLRNRVSYTMVIDNEAGAPPSVTLGGWKSATFYSYDIHGNVDTILQDYRDGAMYANNEFKKIVYNYDLISGKVNQVSYQPGKPDAFYHRYLYDAENKLVQVETSKDSVVWERDANYYYYRHGPLAKTILGDNQVQGMDYAYTLQGWLKGVNSTSVNDGQFDIGNDGIASGPFSLFARDAFGFSLNYYNGDYNPISSTVHPFANISMPLPVNSSAPDEGTGRELFNGNIAAMAVNIPKLGSPKVYGYQYDQLNRLLTMDMFNGLNNSNNSFATPVRSNEYHERISYDANGNILTYLRNGDAQRLSMDNMTYTYKPNSNQLDKVYDAAPDAAASVYDKYNDIKQGQNNGNYSYDAIGNLVSDASEGITNISWNVYGKIQSITKSNGTNISYRYDASGNRISKTVNGKETCYVRDASGNVMAVYEKANVSAHLFLTETHLYGSSRFGVYNRNVDVDIVAGNSVYMEAVQNEKAYHYAFERGKKSYELSNHLGNVLVTISDKKLQHSSNNSTIDYYEADITNANDYYPFGMLQPYRNYSVGNEYRYGFNGKERDNDIDGNNYDYGFRIYNPLIAKFLSVDPLMSSYSYYTPYQFAGNKPISAIDLDGLEEYIVITTLHDDGGKEVKILYTTKKGTKDAVNLLFKTVTKRDPDGNAIKYGYEWAKGHKIVRTTYDSKGGLVSRDYGETLSPDEKSILKKSKLDNDQSDRDVYELTDQGKKYESETERDVVNKLDDYIAVKQFAPVAKSKPAPAPSTPVPPPPKATPKPEELCFKCFNGEYDTHLASGARGIADWLKNNPNYNLKITADGGGAYIFFKDNWKSKQGWGSETFEQHTNSMFERLKKAVTLAGGDSSRVMPDLGNADGDNLKYTPVLKR
jgi:RHS repeat-associated protein